MTFRVKSKKKKEKKKFKKNVGKYQQFIDVLIFRY